MPKEDTINLDALPRSWGAKKIMFGNEHRGMTYQQVSTRDPECCYWIRTSTTHLNDAMQQFIQYLEGKENLPRKETRHPEDSRARRPRTRARRADEEPTQQDTRMADAARKRAPSDESWEDGTV
eukprot:2089089-Pyramimonas_sp.AAC.1